MTSASDFQSLTASVFASQETEIILAKQAALAEYGRELRAILQQLPSEAVRGLLSEYRELTPALVAALEAAILARETALENTAQEADWDQAWLSGATPRRMSERGLSAGDERNEPKAP